MKKVNVTEKEVLWNINKENKAKWTIEKKDEKGESKWTKLYNAKAKSKLNIY